MAVPFTLFFLMLSREEEPDDPMFAVVFGLDLGLVFALTAVSERFRQRRLKRMGVVSCCRFVEVGEAGSGGLGGFLGSGAGGGEAVDSPPS
ncbi:hypothetical protein [Streptomyces yanii]|uniref:Uncharacterized protein n=1 Tax=Streptomyces yanii TaxID=78510 RepID=A0ABV5R802_9ACTN